MNKSLYFSHDYTASEDVKLLFLRQSLGFEGLGLFWFIIERLAQSGGRMPLKILPVLSMQMQVPENKLMSVIKDFELFEIEETTFYSRRLMETIDLRKTLQDAGAKGAAKRWGNNDATKPPKIKLS